jgi:2-polyprenyl-6-methoxyphenol hydroxylase-like FAD-dependent oxidoreductase
MSSNNQIYDVLIVGAGPVGLATAIALYRRGVKNILVIDQTRGFREVGQIVDLLPNGLKSLKVIDEEAYQQIKQFGLDFMQIPQGEKRFWHCKNLEGKTIRSTCLDFDYWYKQYGEGRVSLPWYQLQTILRNLLPPEIILINHHCLNFSQKTDSIIIECVCDRTVPTNPFAHWEMNTANEVNPSNENLTRKQFQGKLVVAADGINSTVRKLMYANSDLEQWAKPHYSGISAVGCFEINNVSDDLIQQLEAQYWQGQRIITILPNYGQDDQQKSELASLILIRKKEGSIGYLCHLSLNLDIVKNQSPEITINSVIDILKKNNFPPILTQVIQLTNYEKLIRRPYYIHPANIAKSKSIWSQGRLVLVGDAAHGMPPLAPQGANQGLEDAAVIGTIVSNIINNSDLDNLEKITEQFNKYEQLRRPLMEKVQIGTMENHRQKQQDWDNFSHEIYGRNIESMINSFVIIRENL